MNFAGLKPWQLGLGAVLLGGVAWVAFHKPSQSSSGGNDATALTGVPFFQSAALPSSLATSLTSGGTSLQGGGTAAGAIGPSQLDGILGLIQTEISNANQVTFANDANLFLNSVVPQIADKNTLTIDGTYSVLDGTTAFHIGKTVAGLNPNTVTPGGSGVSGSSFGGVGLSGSSTRNSLIDTGNNTTGAEGQQNTLDSKNFADFLASIATGLGVVGNPVLGLSALSANMIAGHNQPNMGASGLIGGGIWDAISNYFNGTPSSTSANSTGGYTAPSDTAITAATELDAQGASASPPDTGSNGSGPSSDPGPGVNGDNMGEGGWT